MSLRIPKQLKKLFKTLRFTHPSGSEHEAIAEMNILSQNSIICSNGQILNSNWFKNWTTHDVQALIAPAGKSQLHMFGSSRID